MSGTSGIWFGFGGPVTTCDPPMGLAALSALVSSSSLDEQCHYIVNDHAQGNIPPGTLILFHAASPSSLARDVMVLTPYDTMAWRGVFDFAAGVLVELEDNRGNFVSDPTGTGVGNFDWGNPTYQGCRVESGGVLVADAGNTAFKSRIVVRNQGYLDITNTTGSLFDVVVDSSFVLLSGSQNVQFGQAVFRQNSFYSGTQTTGTHLVVQAYFDAATLSVDSRSAATYLMRVRLRSGSLFAQPTAGDMTFSENVEFSSFSITHASGTLEVSATTGSSVTIQSAGSYLSVQRSRIDLASISTFSGTALCSVSDSRLSQGAAIQHFGAEWLYLRNSDFSDSTISIAAGSLQYVQINFCRIHGSSSVATLGSGGGGFFTISTTEIAGGAIVQRSASHNQNATLTGSEVRNGGQVSFGAGDREVLVVRCEISAGALMGFAGGPGSSVIQRCRVFNGTLQDVSLSGPVSVQDCFVDGDTSALTVSGNHDGVFVSRSRAMSGVLLVAGSNQSVTASNVTVEGLSTLQISGNSGNRTVQGCSLHGFSGMIVSSASGASTQHSQIHLRGGGVYQGSGTSESATIVLVDGGTVAHNGGTIQRFHKSLNSTLTTGAFAHSNVLYHSAASFGMTAANTNRGLISFIAPGAHVAPVI